MSSVIKHSGDQSRFTIFDPAGTQWPATVVDVQKALSLIGPWARTDVGLKDASTTVKGVAMIATQADVDKATDNTKIITPQLLDYKLKKPQASETVYGTTKYANETERMDPTNYTTSYTPKGLHYVFDKRLGTEAQSGTFKVATLAMAQAGSDDTTAMTPKKVKAAIDALVPIQGTATETAKGVVKIATMQETQDGSSREGTAVSPYAFQKANATEAKFGTIKIASTSEMQAATADNVAVTPKKLRALVATDQIYGVTKLTTSPNKGQSNMALAVNASVVPEGRKVQGKALTGDISFSAGDFDAWNRGESDGRYLMRSQAPAGAMIRTGQTQDATWVSNGVYYNLVAEVDTYFDARDGSANRFSNHDVYINDQWVGNVRIESYVSKGGSRGHSWKYRTWGHGAINVGRQINPGDRIRMVLQAADMVITSHLKISLSA